MTQVRVRSDEPFEHALRRFVTSCKREGIISELRAHSYFEKPSAKRKRKAKAAKRRLMKKSWAESKDD